LNLAFCWIWSKIFTTDHHSSDTNDIESDTNAAAQTTEGEQTEVETAAPLVASPPKKKPQVHYMTNLKIFLTFLVIIFHSFSGLMTEVGTLIYFEYSQIWYIWKDSFVLICQSYFMNLFFFVSGYFIPKSLDRKGTNVFLIDRAKRIGIPFVISNFILVPYVNRGFDYLLLSPRTTPFSTYLAATKLSYPGPAWFLLQLLGFGVAYTVLCGEGWSPKVSCPSFWGLIGIGLILGAYSGVMTMFFPNESIIGYTPIFWSFFLSYIVFFFAGALAQRNNWMEDIKNMNRTLIYSFTIVTTAPVVAGRWLYFEEGIAPFWSIELFSGLTFAGGFFAVSWSLSVTVFFMDFMDKKFFCTDFFAKTMYTAYIIHYVFPRIVGWYCALLVLEATGNAFLVTEPVEGFSLPPPFWYGSNPDLLIPFCLLSAAISVLITWTLAYAIYKIPGFSQVL